MSADECLNYGMINKVVNVDKNDKNSYNLVDQEAIKLAKEITVHSPTVTALGK